MHIACDLDRPVEQPRTNAELHQEIASVVVREVLKLPRQIQVKLCPLQSLDFSSTFSIDWRLDGDWQGVFVKIPNVEVRKRQVGLITSADRSFAAEEYGSLVRLSQAWDGANLGVSFIKPLAFLPDYNAIITQRAYGREFFALFRRLDLRRRLAPGADEQMLDCLNRLGRALAGYHRNCGEERLFEVEATEAKIHGYLARLQELHVDRALLSQIGRALSGLRMRVASTHLTDTIKGLDIRNILIDSQSRLFLLDPGKLKRDYEEADLARFLVTCRILFWGSLWLFLRLTPHRVCEQSFLQGYYGEGHPTWVLTVFTIKELLKHWLMAHVALGLNRWPLALRNVVKRTYIDPFYRQEIRVELRKLAPGSGY